MPEDAEWERRRGGSHVPRLRHPWGREQSPGGARVAAEALSFPGRVTRMSASCTPRGGGLGTWKELLDGTSFSSRRGFGCRSRSQDRSRIPEAGWGEWQP